MTETRVVLDESFEGKEVKGYVNKSNYLNSSERKEVEEYVNTSEYLKNLNNNLREEKIQLLKNLLDDKKINLEIITLYQKVPVIHNHPDIATEEMNLLDYVLFEGEMLGNPKKIKKDFEKSEKRKTKTKYHLVVIYDDGKYSSFFDGLGGPSLEEIARKYYGGSIL